MSQPPPDTRAVRRLALLQHGGLTSGTGKTGLSLLRYAHADVVVVIDRAHAGRTVREVTGIPTRGEVPIVASMTDALRHRPDALAIGIAVLGGRLPEAYLGDVRSAVQNGVSIWNGLHTPLASDPVIAAALRPGVYVWDMRREPAGIKNGGGLARTLSARRTLFVGTDMAIGKMTGALELDAASKRRGFRSKFIATGQAGMMIAGDGVCLDAVRVDFASGAIEAEVMRAGASHDYIWVEGQGSILNPASTATLPLLRGTQPTHLILVHRARMTHLQDFPHVPVPPLDRVVALYEQLASAAGAYPPVPVVGLALNTWGLTDAEARTEVDATAQITGLPCTDVVRFGADVLLDAVLAHDDARAPALARA